MEKKNYVVYYRGKSLHFQGFVKEVIAESKDEAIEIGRKLLLPDILRISEKNLPFWYVEDTNGRIIGEYSDVVPYEIDGGGGRINAVEIDPDDSDMLDSHRYCLYVQLINSDGTDVLGYFSLLGTFYGRSINDSKMIKRIKDYIHQLKPDCERIFSIPEDIFDNIFVEFNSRFNGKEELILSDYNLKFYLENNTWDYLRFGFPKPLE